jgi:hypothetical protein
VTDDLEQARELVTDMQDASGAIIVPRASELLRIDTLLAAVQADLTSLRAVVHEVAHAGVEAEARKYLVVQIGHETMAEARRLALATEEEKP